MRVFYSLNQPFKPQNKKKLRMLGTVVLEGNFVCSYRSLLYFLPV